MTRAKTVEEMRREFLDQVRVLVTFWAKHGDGPFDIASGVAHSMLALMEGRMLGIPAFDLLPAVSPDDVDYSRGIDENWWVREDINDGALASALFNGPGAERFGKP